MIPSRTHTYILAGCWPLSGTHLHTYDSFGFFSHIKTADSVPAFFSTPTTTIGLTEVGIASSEVTCQQHNLITFFRDSSWSTVKWFRFCGLRYRNTQSIPGVNEYLQGPQTNRKQVQCPCTDKTRKLSGIKKKKMWGERGRGVQRCCWHKMITCLWQRTRSPTRTTT